MVINKALLKMKRSLTRSNAISSTGQSSNGSSSSSKATVPNDASNGSSYSIGGSTTGNNTTGSTGSANSSVTDEQNLERNIELPGERDILLGRGRTSWSHTGNQQFRSFVGLYLKRYTDCKSRVDKTKTVHLIYDEIIHAGGRFLKLDTGTGTWYQVGKSVAREKIAHTLRDAIGLRIKLTAPEMPVESGPSGADAAKVLLGGDSRSTSQRKKQNPRAGGSALASKSNTGGVSIFSRKPEEEKVFASPFPLFFPAAANDYQRSRLFVASEVRPDDSVSADEVLSCSTATLSNVSVHNSSQAGGNKSVQHESGDTVSGSGNLQKAASKKQAKETKSAAALSQRELGGFPPRASQQRTGATSGNSGSVRSADKKCFNDLVNSMLTELGEEPPKNKEGASSTPSQLSTPIGPKMTAADMRRQQHEQRTHDQRMHDQRMHEQRRAHQEQLLHPDDPNFDIKSAAITLADDDISAGFSTMSLETSRSGRSVKSGNMSTSRSKCDSKCSMGEGSQNTVMFELSEEFRTRTHTTALSPTVGLVGNVGVQSMQEHDLLLRHRGKVANSAQPSFFGDGRPAHHTQAGLYHHDDAASLGGGSMDWAKGLDVVSDFGSLDDFSLASKETGFSSVVTKNPRIRPAPTREKFGNSQDSRKQESSMDSSEKSSETEREWRRTLQALRSS
jgi:hypothetical protein